MLFMNVINPGSYSRKYDAIFQFNLTDDNLLKYEQRILQKLYIYRIRLM